MVEAIKAGAGASTRNGPETTGMRDEVDDFARCDIGEESDLFTMFIDRFYFRREAEDPANAWAFDTPTNPGKARLNVMFGSGIGHFNLQDMAVFLPEAYELVEDDLVTGGDFRDFVCDSAIRFWGQVNPTLFKETRVADTARDVLYKIVNTPSSVG